MSCSNCMFKYLILLVSVATLVIGCDSQTALERDAELLIQTEEAEYSLVADNNGLATEISYSFENRTGHTVYLSNCNGSFALQLERLQGNEWEVAWEPVLPACLSAPITIERGEVYETTLNIWAGFPGSNSFPQFDAPDFSGTYRIVWVSAYSSYDENEFPFGSAIPLEQRVSNSFLLRIE